MEKRINLSSAVAEAISRGSNKVSNYLASRGERLKRNVNNRKKQMDKNIVHAKDLQTRFQVVADRKHPSKTVDIYGTNPNGFRTRKKSTRAEYRKLQDKIMSA